MSLAMRRMPASAAGIQAHCVRHVRRLPWVGGNPQTALPPFREPPNSKFRALIKRLRDRWHRRADLLHYFILRP
jgi:hypothetical protein